MQQSRKWVLLLEAVRHLQAGNWQECANSLKRMELPDLGNYRGNLSALWTRAFFLKLQLLHKLRRTEEFDSLYRDYKSLADSRLEEPQRNYLDRLYQLTNQAQDAKTEEERYCKLASCLIALDRIKTRLRSWRFEKESKAKPLTLKLRSDGLIDCPENRSFHLDMQEYPAFYQALCDNHNILHRTALAEILAALAAFAKIVDLLAERSGKEALQRLRNCFPPVADEQYDDPFFRHDRLYRQRVDDERPGNTPGIPAPLERLRTALYDKAPNLDRELTSYQGWYQSVGEALGLASAPPPHFAFLQRACAAAQPADLALADWLLDF